MPARLAMSAVVAASRPRAANSETAAVSTCSRRSSAVLRVLVVAMPALYVIAHSHVKGPHDDRWTAVSNPLGRGLRQRLVRRRRGVLGQDAHVAAADREV